ncbi:MAG: ester cyclase, partial [Actinobacteria bacterium]|nr:ester cyclase [Actinomycetota bacterium]
SRSSAKTEARAARLGTERRFRNGKRMTGRRDARPGDGQRSGSYRRMVRAVAAAFPDASWESAHKHESGNVAIDEGYVVGTHTGPLPMPDGQSIPPTGKSVRVRGCDAATVEDGRVKSHRFYFDQMELLGQLGLTPEA